MRAIALIIGQDSVSDHENGWVSAVDFEFLAGIAQIGIIDAIYFRLLLFLLDCVDDIIGFWITPTVLDLVF